MTDGIDKTHSLHKRQMAGDTTDPGSYANGRWKRRRERVVEVGGPGIRRFFGADGCRISEAVYYIT